MSEMDGLVALVTGGASGIGAATVVDLRLRGATVAVLDLDPGGDPEGVPCDVRDDAAVRAAVERVVRGHGRLDVVVANAGIGAVGDVERTSDEEWQQLLDVNVVGAARVVRAALPALRASPHASVVLTSSVVAHVGVPQRAAYAASKGALAALALAMAADHVHEGIRVNAVLPGTTDTPWVGRLLAAAEHPEAAATALRARQPMGRLVRAEEVAAAIAYLAGPGSAATTGTLLAVDGGMGGLRLPAASPARSAGAAP
jgi:NAD(P)-dependent dehydrogenase (short-subunit alcohol dehydrogenase family)